MDNMSHIHSIKSLFVKKQQTDFMDFIISHFLQQFLREKKKGNARISSYNPISLNNTARQILLIS